jgi:Ser/Thr protein kinase RdoA (MazF antagonist)
LRWQEGKNQFEDEQAAAKRKYGMGRELEGIKSFRGHNSKVGTSNKKCKGEY